MTNIPLYILDEYAKHLTDSQVAMLYEHKCGKTYEKVLNEDFTKTYNVYLSDNTIFYDTVKDKNEFLMDLIQIDSPLLESIQYKISEDGIEFRTREKAQFNSLISDLSKSGISKESIDFIINENL